MVFSNFKSIFYLNFHVQICIFTYNQNTLVTHHHLFTSFKTEIQTQPHTVYKHANELVLIFNNAVHLNRMGFRLTMIIFLATLNSTSLIYRKRLGRIFLLYNRKIFKPKVNKTNIWWKEKPKMIIKMLKKRKKILKLFF